MSGKPNIEQIRQLRQALADADKERKLIDEARSEISHRELCISSASLRLDKLMATIKRLLEAMDVATPGNFGHEGRMLALLTDLSAESQRHARSSP